RAVLPVRPCPGVLAALEVERLPGRRPHALNPRRRSVPPAPAPPMAGLLGAGGEELVSGRPALLDAKQDDGSMSSAEVPSRRRLPPPWRSALGARPRTHEPALRRLQMGWPRSGLLFGDSSGTRPRRRPDISPLRAEYAFPCPWMP